MPFMPAHRVYEKSDFFDVSSTPTTPSLHAYPNWPLFADDETEYSDESPHLDPQVDPSYPTLLPTTYLRDPSYGPRAFPQQDFEINRTFAYTGQRDLSSPRASNCRFRTCPVEPCDNSLDVSPQVRQAPPQKRVSFGCSASLDDFDDNELLSIPLPHFSTPVKIDRDGCQQINRKDRQRMFTTEELREDFFDAQGLVSYGEYMSPDAVNMRVGMAHGSTGNAPMRVGAFTCYSKDLLGDALRQGGVGPRHFNDSRPVDSTNVSMHTQSFAHGNAMPAPQARAAFREPPDCIVMNSAGQGCAGAFPPRQAAPPLVHTPPSSQPRYLAEWPQSATSAGPQRTSPTRRAGNGSSRPRNKRALRLWAHVYLHMERPGFNVVPMLIGRRGQNLRRIAETTNAKLRIRGRGSGHLEVDGKYEAPTPLMIAVTSDRTDREGFRLAMEMTLAELRNVETRYRVFLAQDEVEAVAEPCFSIGLLSPGAERLLEGVLEGVAFQEKSRPGH